MEITYFGPTRQAAQHSLDLLYENFIQHVDKTDNPANSPEARPIKDFGSFMKNRYYQDNWEAKTYSNLKIKSINA